MNGSNSPKFGSAERSSDAIAIGTTSGSILVFSLKTGDVTVNLNKKNAPHKDRVNGMVRFFIYVLRNVVVGACLLRRRGLPTVTTFTPSLKTVSSATPVSKSALS